MVGTASPHFDVAPQNPLRFTPEAIPDFSLARKSPRRIIGRDFLQTGGNDSADRHSRMARKHAPLHILGSKHMYIAEIALSL